jgi:hypothetical protein
MTNTIEKGSASFEYLFDESPHIPGALKTFPIPGLSGAWSNGVNGLQFSEEMTPQGLAVSEKYIFVSAYDPTKTVNSVIYLIDQNKSELLKTIVIHNKAHLGGIYFDEEHQELWATGDWKHGESVTIFSMEQFENYDIFDGQNLKPLKTFNLSSSPSSFLTVSGGQLFVGSFDVNKPGLVSVYRITRTENSTDLVNFSSKPYLDEPQEYLSNEQFVTIKQNQGLAINGSDLLMSSSYGPGKSILTRHHFNESEYTNGKFVELFPYLEQIVLQGRSSVYLLFEGGAKQYRKRSSRIIDRIIVADLEQLFLGAKDYKRMPEIEWEYILYD